MNFTTLCGENRHTDIANFATFKGKPRVHFSENRFFFGLKFSLNLLEYEAKGFIHENVFFCLISRFS